MPGFQEALVHLAIHCVMLISAPLFYIGVHAEERICGHIHHSALASPLERSNSVEAGCLEIPVCQGLCHFCNVE